MTKKKASPGAKAKREGGGDEKGNKDKNFIQRSPGRRD